MRAESWGIGLKQASLRSATVGEQCPANRARERPLWKTSLSSPSNPRGEIKPVSLSGGESARGDAKTRRRIEATEDEDEAPAEAPWRREEPTGARGIGNQDSPREACLNPQRSTLSSQLVPLPIPEGFELVAGG